MQQRTVHTCIWADRPTPSLPCGTDTCPVKSANIGPHSLTWKFALWTMLYSICDLQTNSARTIQWSVLSHIILIFAIMLSHIGLICSALIRQLSFARRLSTVTSVAHSRLYLSSWNLLMGRWTQIVSLRQFRRLLYHSTLVTQDATLSPMT